MIVYIASAMYPGGTIDWTRLPVDHSIIACGARKFTSAQDEIMSRLRTITQVRHVNSPGLSHPRCKGIEPHSVDTTAPWKQIDSKLTMGIWRAVRAVK